MFRQHCQVMVAALLLLGSPAAAQSFGRPLTAEQVACEERQLERLQHRMDVHSLTGALFLWRASAGGGLYRGLASTNELFPDDANKPSRQEKQLAFDLIFKMEQDFLSPRQRPRPQTTLVRRNVDSNLTSSPNAPYFGIGLDVAPVVEDPTTPILPLRITNRVEPGTGHDDRAGRGVTIDDFLSACHAEVSEFDLRVFSILSRTVRPSQCLLEPFSSCGAGLDRYRVVFFRGAEPLTYQMNIYTYLVACDDDDRCSYGEARTAFVFRLQVDERGRLIGGDVEALPWCTGPDQVGCTFFFNPDLALFVLPPLRPGIERQGEEEFQRAAHLNLVYEGSPDNVLSDTVNWLDLLRDTVWNEGRPAAAVDGGQPEL